ncbi:MAG TPA: sigma-70 family RNA polymerase sigma factor [Thermoleophilaceae bacterium]|nr:sigma-70 family RNA polymerase sigma factor [Thermoleophilaceae bacterium]
MEAHSLAHAGGLKLPRSRAFLAALGDERLVDQVRRGNEAAFEVLYDRYHGSILSYCRHMLGSRDEGEDALQQAFVSAHADLMASDKPVRFKPWLYAIARNRCLSMLRARREQPSDDLERISTAGLSEEVQQRADLQEVVADIQDLPDEQRGALILAELGDLSHAEVAQIIGCEAAKVKSLVFQARSGLMERREARETPCAEIREQLSVLRGGSLRRGPLRRHLKACPGCREFRAEVRRQRQMVAAILPVIPTLGLKESALAAAGVGVGAGSAGGAAALAGGGAALAAKASVAKIAVIAVATTGAVGGAVAVQQAAGGGDGRDRDRPAAESAPAGAPGATDALPGVPGEGRAEDHTRRLNRTPAADAKRDRGRADARSDGKNGFDPKQGGSGGDRARDFAAGRGEGKHLGIEKQAERGTVPRGQTKPDGPRGQSGQAKAKAPGQMKAPGQTKEKPASAGPKPKPEKAKPAPNNANPEPGPPEERGPLGKLLGPKPKP